MKTILLLQLLLIILPFSLIAQEVSFEAVENINGITVIKGTKEPFTGKTVAFYPDGKKSLEIEYRNGIESGTNRSWYNDGKIMNETQIDSGKINGYWIDYYPNGVKENEVIYENDFMNGPCTRRYDNGNVKETGRYSHCREEGLWIYYWENGAKKAQGEYRESIKTGEWQYWDKNGSILKEAPE